MMAGLKGMENNEPRIVGEITGSRENESGGPSDGRLDAEDEKTGNLTLTVTTVRSVCVRNWRRIGWRHVDENG